MVRQAAGRQERAGVGGVGAHGPPAVTLARILKTSSATGGAALGSACESPGPPGFLSGTQGGSLPTWSLQSLGRSYRSKRYQV